MISRMLVVSLLLLPFQSIQAGMVSTDQVSAAASAQARVDAMTDSEVASLANQLNSLPAGASSSNSGWWIAAAVIIIILVWYNWK